MSKRDGGPAFPEGEAHDDDWGDRMTWATRSGVSRAEFFGAFALAGMLAFDDTARRDTTCDAAALYGFEMVEAFERVRAEEEEDDEPEAEESDGPWMSPRDADPDHLLDVVETTTSDLACRNARVEIKRRIGADREAGVRALRRVVLEEFRKIRDQKGELEADAALETIERLKADVIPVPGDPDS